MKSDELKTAEYVLAELERHAGVLRGFGVKRIGLFGSVARGESKPDSDLDFVVELERWTCDDFLGTAFFLEDLFGCEVDLVPLDSIRPQLRNYILPEIKYAQGV